ncbi:MAG TPA: hypothetical protein VF988_09980 [Verrucomicrobiae bacterium]
MPAGKTALPVEEIATLLRGERDAIESWLNRGHAGRFAMQAMVIGTKTILPTEKKFFLVHWYDTICQATDENKHQRD